MLSSQEPVGVPSYVRVAELREGGYLAKELRSIGLKAAELDRSVTMLTSHHDPHQCNSYWAQGGIIYKV